MIGLGTLATLGSRRWRGRSASISAASGLVAERGMGGFAFLGLVTAVVQGGWSAGWSRNTARPG